MKIEYFNDEEKSHFCDLPVNAVFIYEGNLFLKVDEFHYKKNNLSQTMNTYGLESGSYAKGFTFFSDDACVSYCKNAVLYPFGIQTGSTLKKSKWKY